MDVYQIWFDRRSDVRDTALAEALDAFLSHMKATGRIAGWRLLRCKLGFRPDNTPEFQLLIETEDLAQLDTAFQAAAERTGEADRLHFAANTLVENVRFGLFRDWPD